MKLISFVKLILAALSLSIFSLNSAANELNIGIKTGLMDIDLNSIPETDSYFETGIGNSLFIDYRLTNHISLGGYYARASEANHIKVGDLTGAWGELWEFIDDVLFFGLLNPGIYATVDIDVDFYGFNARYFIGSHRPWEVYISGGFSWWESNISVSVPSEATVSDTTSGHGINYGAGMKRIFNESWVLSINYEKADFEDISINMFTVGVEWLF